MSLYERLFPRFRPRRELRPQGSGEGWGARITWLGTAGFIIESAETTLLVERIGYAQGVALGLGELNRISSGRVMAFRGPRPAVRVVAGTGPLYLSFDTEAERDRAAAELLDETGLGPDGKGIRTP